MGIRRIILWWCEMKPWYSDVFDIGSVCFVTNEGAGMSGNKICWGDNGGYGLDWQVVFFFCFFVLFFWATLVFWLWREEVICMQHAFEQGARGVVGVDFTLFLQWPFFIYSIYFFAGGKQCVWGCMCCRITRQVRLFWIPLISLGNVEASVYYYHDFLVCIFEECHFPRLCLSNEQDLEDCMSRFTYNYCAAFLAWA